MTQKLLYRKGRIAFTAILLVFIAFMLVNIHTVTQAVTDGFSLSVRVILPSLFPFLILSTLLSDSIPSQAEDGGRASLFSALFRLPNAAMAPLLLGLLSGFPIGAKSTARLYARGLLKKEEAERLLLFVNNTGPAFLIGGIGTLFYDIQVGIFLFAVQTASVMLFGLLSAIGKPKATVSLPSFVHEDTPSFVRAVEDCVAASLKILGFVTAFSVLLALFSLLIPSELAMMLFSLLLELGSAASALSHLTVLPLTGILPLLSFGVSFSGLSVYMQTRAVLQGSGLSFRYYLPAKLLQGLLAALLSFLFAGCFF